MKKKNLLFIAVLGVSLISQVTSVRGETVPVTVGNSSHRSSILTQNPISIASPGKEIMPLPALQTQPHR